MAIFKKKTEKREGEKADLATPSTPKQSGVPHSYADVLRSVRVTEKATDLSAKNAYVFNVDPRAGKKEIAAAVRAIYKVTPIRVSTLPVKGKTTFVRGKKGKTVGGKKAVVYLKEGDKIESV